jgi:pimeloyl-ACP methyl ester carboxylesterase
MSDLEASPIRFRGAGGVAIAGDRWGTPGERTVLLLHGGGQTRHAWGGTARALAEAGTCAITLDARGHGDSGWASEGDYRLEAFVDDVLAVTEQLGVQPILVGASLGGLTSLLLEGEVAPGTARAIVLVDVVPRVEPDGADRIHQFMTGNPEGFADLEEAAAAIALYLPHRPNRGVPPGLQKNLRQGKDGRWRWHWDPAFLSEQALTAVRDVDRMRACARSLRPPTLLVRGRMSDIVSEAGAAELLADCPHAKFVDVSEAGHMVAGDRNDAFTAAVVEFLREAR